MPNWKKIIISGSNASLRTVTASVFLATPGAISVGFQGTSSWAQNAVSASYAPGGTPITFYNGNANASYSNLTTLYVSGSGVTISNPSAGIVSMSIAGVPAGSGTTISNNVNNYIVTATGTTPELNGEANLTFNGSTLAVTGNVTATSFTGSLLGTASYATNALTASYALTAGVAGSGTTFAAGNTNNRVVTATGNVPGELNGEANLTFDGSTLAVTGNVTATSFTGSLLGTAASASVANSVYFTASNANINYGISLGPQVGDVGRATMYTKTGYSINPSEYSNKGLLDANNIRVDERLIIKRALLMSRGLGTLQASNYVIGSADLFVLVDTNFAVDIDLRDAENADNDGRVIVVKDGAGKASINPITFTTGANIEAGTGYSPDDNWESIVLVWDNNLNTWWVIAKFIP